MTRSLEADDFSKHLAHQHNRGLVLHCYLLRFGPLVVGFWGKKKTQQLLGRLGPGRKKKGGGFPMKSFIFTPMALALKKKP